jgi:hypothetical protein
MLKKHFYILLATTVLTGIMIDMNAQVSKEEFNELKQTIEQLKSENSSLANKLNNQNQLQGETKSYAPLGLVLFLFGAFCAVWAQNTGRNAWLWFFLGVIFSVLTVIILLINNSNDSNN